MENFKLNISHIKEGAGIKNSKINKYKLWMEIISMENNT